MEVYFDNLTAKNARLDELAEEMESLAQNAEELVRSGGAKLPEADRQRLTELLARLRSSAGLVKQQALRGLRATDHAIRTHPYESLGIALVARLLVGALIGRLRSSSGKCT